MRKKTTTLIYEMSSTKLTAIKNFSTYAHIVFLYFFSKAASVIVQRGTLKKGDYIIAGIGWAKVRSVNGITYLPTCFGENP